jgi:hypothetical protein
LLDRQGAIIGTFQKKKETEVFALLVAGARCCTALVIAGLVMCSESEPEIVMTSPVHSSTVAGLVSVSAYVADDVEVNTLGLFIDDSLVLSVNENRFEYAWNTFSLPESSSHEMYAIAHIGGHNPIYSDLITVMVCNETLLFADDFELYATGTYPTCGWYVIWQGNFNTCVEEDSGVSNNHFFRQSGVSDSIRTDAVALDMNGIQGLTYEFRVMIPESSAAGMLAGFYVKIHPYLGTIFNGVQFDNLDHTVEVRGVDPVATGYSWTCDTWYTVKVSLDYDNRLMDVWIGNTAVAQDVVAASADTSNVFCLSTAFNTEGFVFYDDVMIYRHE